MADVAMAATGSDPVGHTPGAAHVRVCGEVSITGPGGAVAVRGRQPRAVLAFLALERRAVQRDELAELLWGERLGLHWQGALRGVLSKIRAVLVAAGLPPGALRSEDLWVTVDWPPGTTTDTADAADAVAQASIAASHDDHAGTLAALAGVEEIVTSPFLPANDSDWSRGRREEMLRLASRQAHLQVSALLGLGRSAEAIEVATRAVAVDPIDETAHHLRIQALLADGQRARALAAFAELTETLEAELGTAPAASTAELIGDPGPAATRRSADHHPPQVHHPDHHHPHHGEPFVGRRAERHALLTCWRDVIEGRRPVMAVVEGPAGSGKTRLVSVVCSELRSEGARVLWGHSREDPGRSYGPIADALAAAIAQDSGLVDRLGGRAAALAGLLPELTGNFGDYRVPEDTAVARTHLFGAVRAAVAELARTPTVLVLDDIQWLSPDTVALLEAVLDGIDGTLLVLATAREVPATMAGALASIQRQVPIRNVRLSGLEADDLAVLLADHLPPGRSEQVTALVHARTGGLAFFAAEILREARRTDATIDPDGIPDSVRDWLTRRVTALPEQMRVVLEWSAVLGTGSDRELLERCCPLDADALTAHCDALVDRGFLALSADPGTLQFAHLLTRDVVHESQGMSRRARMHTIVADTMADSPDLPGRHAEIARHYREAGTAHRPSAARHAELAGVEALDQGSWQAGEAHFAECLELALDAHRRVRALVGLGRSRLGQARFGDARTALEEAIALSRDHGFVTEHARAALALAGRAGRGASGAGDDAQVALLEGARAALANAADVESDRAGDDDAGADHTGDTERDRAMLLSRVEGELVLARLFTESPTARRKVLRGALNRVRALRPPDHSAVGSALLAQRFAKVDPGDLGSRLADVDEVLDMPASRLSPEILISAHCYRHEELLRLGDHSAAQAALARADDLATRYDHPYWRWAIHTWRGLRHLIDGDIAAAETTATEAAAMQEGVDGAVACFGVNLVNIRLYQRRTGEVLDLLGAAADAHPEIPCYRAVLSLCASEAGESRACRDHFEHFAEAGFDNLTFDTNRFLGLAVLAHVAADLEHREGGRVLDELLAPYRGRTVLLNCYGGGGAYWGPATHGMARLAALDGRAADAGALFAEAANEAAAAPLALERIRDHAAVLGHASAVGEPGAPASSAGGRERRDG